MAECWLCSTKAGKRYCAPLDKVICPVCCATNRLKKINCNDDCRYLSGVALQSKRVEEKEFAELMHHVPHGQYDDIFKDAAVKPVAYDIETLVRDIYTRGAPRITDRMVYEAYKTVYVIHFQGKLVEESQLDELAKELLALYARSIDIWKSNMDQARIGQVFLRLMISVKAMSGGRMGEFGYVNFLKNNLERAQEEVIIEDKFGHKATKMLAW